MTDKGKEKVEILCDLAELFSASLEFGELLGLLVQKAAEFAGVSRATISLIDEEKGVLKAAARHAPHPNKRLERMWWKLELPIRDNPLAKRVAEAGKPVVIPDMLTAPGIAKLLETFQIKSILIAPLMRKGKPVGILTLDDPGKAHSFDPSIVEAMETFAGLAALAIENARLYEQTDEKLRDRVDELEALNAIAQSLTSPLELDESLKSIVSRVAQITDARICTIRFVEGDELTIGAAVGCKNESARQHRIKIDRLLAGIVRDQKPLVIEDLWTAKGIPQSRRMRALRERVHAFLGVPMTSREKTIGILSIYKEKPHRFREEEIRLLSTVAHQTAMAVERARLHEKVKRHATELEHLVEERTKELRAIQKEMILTSNLAALGQLAAGVAHELNNPLGAISGYLELLQEETELEPEAIDYLQRVEKRIRQATKIVAELKDLGTPSEPAWQVVDLNSVIEEPLHLLERGLVLHQIEVQKELAPDLPKIVTDPERLEQVLLNLVNNSRQAMKESGVLKIATQGSPSGEWVELIVADSGEGIPKENLERIFEPFFTTRGPGEGMGLGLSVVHRLVRNHGGIISVWSEEGKGTVFRVALPTQDAKRCWEILNCPEKERCKVVREKADYRCWSMREDVSRCEGCEVYRRKALLTLDGTLLPE